MGQWPPTPNGDAGVIALDPTPATGRDLVFTSQYHDPPAVGVTSFVHYNDVQVGEVICQTGYWNKYRCGTVKALGATLLSCERDLNFNCKPIKNQVTVSFDSSPGESGAPYYNRVDTYSGYGITLDGYGIHTHSDPDDLTTDKDSWYTPVRWARYAYWEKTGKDYRFCLTSSCDQWYP